VFEHPFSPSPAPADIELVALFDDPPRALIPAGHPLAPAASLTPADLAGDTWIRPHHGSAADLVDYVLARAQLQPPILRAGHGDEPIEAQAFVAAGNGIAVAHRLNVVLDPAQIAAVPLRDAPVRHIQAAIMREHRAPAALAALEALHEIGRRHTSR
jgi:DNA-binding transcriptional LysR family regulator